MTSSDGKRIEEQSQDVYNWAGSDEDLLPVPAEKVRRVHLAASLMQKAIRRGKALCSTDPLLEACTTLLKPEDAPPGSTLAMLKTLWECMLVDASPFCDGDDCLGLPSLLLLSLVAKANSAWTMPTSLQRAAVACAIRTAVSAPAQPWLGFADRIDDWWQLEEYEMETAEMSDQKACTLRNILRATQAVVGGRLAWGKWNSFIGDASAAAVISYINHDAWDGSYLPNAPSPLAEEITTLPSWEGASTSASLPMSLEPRFHLLDNECRLSAIEPTILPSTLVLLQALLSRPPTKWQKHSLPSLSKQVRKLISEANPRYRERVQLARLSTWGKEKAGSVPMSSVPGRSAKNDEEDEKKISPPIYNSFREVVTSSGVLSEQETELVDCFEAIQSWMNDRLNQKSPNAHDEHTSRSHMVTPTAVKSASDEETETGTQYIQFKAGLPLSTFDGRVGFLLAFSASIEVEVCPDSKSPSSKEVVSAMFCGDAQEPLLVQRIGKARREGKEAATAGGTTSGATAVPSLGYVQKHRSREEAMLFEATEAAVANHWKRGKITSLPLPPAGWQWDLPNGVEAGDLGWEANEREVKRTAELVEGADGKKEWHFTIAGKQVDAFDARAIMSPCALDIGDTSHQPVSLEPQREQLLRIALYVEDDATDADLVHGKPVLNAMGELHTLAKKDREATRPGLSEGHVYDWMPLACASLLPSRTWRDVLLAIRTREKTHVILGKGIRSDGSGTPLDLSEGVLVRIFHGLECLYPQTIRKDSALKFRVRPRGAAYYHLLASLESLGRGGEGLASRSKRTAPPGKMRAFEEEANTPGGKLQKRGKVQDEDIEQRPRKRPRRDAAVVASKKTSAVFKDEKPVTSKAKSRKPAGSNTRRSGRTRKSTVRPNMEAQDDDSELEDEEERKPRLRKTKRTKRGQPSDDYVQDESSEDEVLEYNSAEEEENQSQNDIEESAEREFQPIPKIKTTLWAHQEASVSKIVEGVATGKRGHADASAVGAGKTLTALATIVRLAQWIEDSGKSRHGVLVMLPTKALIREWLIEIATHTEGFHLIEQREDGSLFSLTYGKTHPPIDANSLVISTLDRVCNHPFVRQVAWDFVVIDECLSVQNAAAKRTPSAWRQIEVSMCGVLMLSATFFRSKYYQLFYMIRMLRSPLPRTIEWLPATIHEHIVCQIPETDRTWQMKGEMVPLAANDLRQYRGIIDAFRRKQINEPSEVDGRKLWVDLESFLRSKYEGRVTKTTYGQASPMADAFVKVARRLLQKKRRPLIFADTSQEADFLLRSLRKKGLDACPWSSIATRQISSASKSKGVSNKTVIVAIKTVEGQGINMQGHADAILCRPTPGDHLEQMKGRVDRPGQAKKDLLLVILVAEHTIEEAKFANIRLAGNFFREYIAPVATKYKERIDLEATLAAGGTKKLKAGTVSGTWRRQLESEGQSGAFADVDTAAITTSNSDVDMIDDGAGSGKNSKSKKSVANMESKTEAEPKYKPLNKVLRNKGDPRAVRQAKILAKDGKASLSVRAWLFPPKSSRAAAQKKGLPKDSLQRYSDTTPPVVLDRHTVYKAVSHLSSKDPKLAALIARVGADALVRDCGTPMPPTQARLFDRCVRGITFTMVSVDAGNSFMRRLAIKVGVCLENKAPAVRNRLLGKFLRSIKESGDLVDLDSPQDLLDLLLRGKHNELTFTHEMVGELVKECEILKGKRSGYPHLCGVTFPCGKNDDHNVFLEKARAHAREEGEPVSTGYSAGKAGFLVSLVADFESGNISGEKIAKASDREAARMLTGLKGIGDWVASQVMMNFLSRADIMLYGDLTVRNFLNDLYDINHQDDSETLLESAADFGDTGANRNLIDEVAAKNEWAPYRTVVCYLMYHLQEENLVLL